MDPQDANALFTSTSLLSLQGAAAAALLVPNGLRFLISSIPRWVTKWIAFIISLGLSFLVAYVATDPGFMKWIVGFFNGFLVFASAMGINQAAAGDDLQRGGFFSSWI
jgi:hypothetical protein